MARHGKVRVALDVVGEVRDLAVSEELGEDDGFHVIASASSVPGGAVSQPVVGEVRVVGLIRAAHDNLLPPSASRPLALARLDHERHRDVRPSSTGEHRRRLEKLIKPNLADEETR